MGPVSRRDLLRASGRAVVAAGVASQLGWLSSSAQQASPLRSGPNWQELTGRLGGAVVLPGDQGYGVLSRPLNESYSCVRPAAVASCANAADVRAALLWARDNGLPVAARSGGHSYAGYSTTTGLLIDLARDKDITVDLAHGTVSVGAGARIVDLDAALRPHNMVVPTGRCPTLGIGGLTLGGGFGFNSRMLGLTSDALVTTEIVTAAGDVLTCDDRNHADLFWACRGGGGGNFGINTRFTFRLQPVGPVSIYDCTWAWADAAAAITAFQELMRQAPAEFSCQVTATTSGRSTDESPQHAVVTAVGQYFGPAQRLRTLLDPVLTAAAPRHALIEDRPFWSAQEYLSRNVPSDRFAATSDFLQAPLPPDGIATLLAWLGRWPGSGNPDGAAVVLSAWGGAISRVPAAATAFVHRDALFLMATETTWAATDPTDVVCANVQWLDGVTDAMRPYTSGFAYQNFIDPSLPHWEHAYYGDNYPRLAEVKRRYDPDDVFRFPQSVRA